MGQPQRAILADGVGRITVAETPLLFAGAGPRRKGFASSSCPNVAPALFGVSLTAEVIEGTTPTQTLDQISQVGEHHLGWSVEVKGLGVLVHVHLLYADRTSRTGI
jgi:hypothetical protein